LGSLLARPKNHKEKTSVRGTDFGMVIFDSIALQASVTDDCHDTPKLTPSETRRENAVCVEALTDESGWCYLNGLSIPLHDGTVSV